MPVPVRSAPRSAALHALAALAALAILSCSVRRLSESYRCDNNGDCSDGRTCERGFCVERDCPSECSSCNNGGGTCVINCNANRPCGDIQCPPGIECIIRCNNAGACGDVDCTLAEGCEIDCSGPAACGPIHCGKQDCDIECSGIAACPAIDCVDACACDVDCNNPAACPVVSCPEAGGTLCTDQQEPGAACDSSVSVVCDTCN
jgi:hypothetical protein